MRPLFRTMQERIDRVNQVVREQITGIRVIRAFVRDEHEQARYGVANTELTDVSLAVGQLMALMFPTVLLVINVSSVAVLWFGGHRIASGDMQIGALTAFLSYLMQILMSVMMATFMFVMIPRAEVCAERIEEVLDTESSVVPPAEPGDHCGRPRDRWSYAVSTSATRAPRQPCCAASTWSPGRARPPRSSAAPAAARPPCSTWYRGCST